MSTNSNDEKNKLLETLRDGPLKVPLFRNQGSNGEFITASPSKIYTDREGNTKQTTSLSGPELLRMSRLMEKAYDRSAEHREAMKATNEQKPERER